MISDDLPIPHCDAPQWTRAIFACRFLVADQRKIVLEHAILHNLPTIQEVVPLVHFGALLRDSCLYFQSFCDSGRDT